ncbi:MAG: copper chaperone PCu(A)C [Pedobacter sp.]|nr:copper chaperone PCu(A)C [Pedobacter sp.]
MKAFVFACCTLLALPVLAETAATASPNKAVTNPAKPQPATLQSAKVTPPVISDAWISEAPPVAKNNAAYVTVQNGNARDALVAVESPASAKAELHQMSVAGGLMRMQRLPLINLAPKQKLAFGPGGRHIMLIDMKQPLKAGDKVPLTLVFRKAGRVTVEAEVRPVVVDGQSAPAAADDSAAHHH